MWWVSFGILLFEANLKTNRGVVFELLKLILGDHEMANLATLFGGPAAHRSSEHWQGFTELCRLANSVCGTGKFGFGALSVQVSMDAHAARCSE